MLFSEGCKITTENKAGRRGMKTKLSNPSEGGRRRIRAAVAVAKKADVVLMVVGENESTNREAWSEQHLGDRDSLELLGSQEALVKAIVDRKARRPAPHQRSSALDQLREGQCPGNSRRLVFWRAGRHSRGQRVIRRCESRRQVAHQLPEIRGATSRLLRSQAFAKSKLSLCRAGTDLSIRLWIELYAIPLRECSGRTQKVVPAVTQNSPLTLLTLERALAMKWRNCMFISGSHRALAP